MPPVPSLTSAFSALGKMFKVPAASQFASPYMASPAASTPSIPRIGVSSPSALAAAGMSTAPAVPSIASQMTSKSAYGYAPSNAPNATSAVTGKPVYIVPGGQAPNASVVPSTPRDYSSLTSQSPVPNATSVTTGKPVYMPPSSPAVPVVQPKAPQTFAEPIVAPSGNRVDPNTGGVVSGAAALPQAPAAPLAIANTGNTAGAADYSGAAGGAPGGASAPGGAGGTPAVPSLEDDYLKSLRATKEEEDAQARLDELAGAAALADANIGNQPIALPFITGQQAAVERSRAARSVPIASQLARLQAKRQMSLEASKAALEREDKKLERDDKRADSNKPVVVGEKSTLVDPKTGKVVFGGAPAGTETAATGSWSSLIKTGQASLSDVPADMRSAVAEELAASPEISKKGKDAIGQATVVMDYIDQADGQISGFTTGIVGIGSAMIPGTPAYNLARTIDTIKANVGFQALQAMRDASPTGGALGQVSEQENRLLQATLGSLDIGQGEAQLRANMAKVRQHFSNLVAILSAGPGANATIGEDGKVVITGGKGGATTDVASEGWF